MRSIKTITAFSLSFFPALVFAAGPKNLAQLINNITALINPLLTLIAGLAVLAFMWGIVKYIWAQGNESAKADGKKIMIGGVIGLFILFSFWGIIQFIKTEIFG